MTRLLASRWISGSKRVLVAGAAAALVGQFMAALVIASRADAPTTDEPGHIGAGITYLNQRDLSVFTDHPPLARSFGAAGFQLFGGRVPHAVENAPRGHNQANYPIGAEALTGSPKGVNTLIFAARLPLIALTVGFAVVVYLFARDLFGSRAALLSLAFVTSYPAIIANGHLVTTDLPVAGFMLTTLWLLLRAREQSITWAVGAGLTFGLALMAKYNALLLTPAFLGLLLVAAKWPRRTNLRASRRYVVAGVAALMPVVVIWISFISIDPKLHFQEVQPLEASWGFIARVAGAIPLPHAWLDGVKFVLGTDREKRDGFLFGDPYRGGRIYYFPALLLIKSPLPTLLAWAACVVGVAKSRDRNVCLYVLLPACFVLGVSMLSNTNIGFRHIMIVPMLLCVAAPALLRLPVRRIAVVAVGLVVLAAASAWHYPTKSLAYVNEAFGGPKNAYQLVTGSDVDWGQDMERLAKWLKTHPQSEPPWAAFDGFITPRDYGVAYRRLRDETGEQIHGLVAVSVNRFNANRGYFRSARPVARVGESFLVFEFE